MPTAMRVALEAEIRFCERAMTLALDAALHGTEAERRRAREVLVRLRERYLVALAQSRRLDEPA